jgi:Type I phosphodiesterase / nucleotide pyrophosphatase
LNQIKGFDHSGKNAVGVPNIYGMNFQSVSTAQKLPALVAAAVTGGYTADGRTPGPLLKNALIFVDSKLAAMQSAIASSSKNASTVIILTAKHGQSPNVPSSLVRINDGTIMKALNAAWVKKSGASKDLVALVANDNGMQVWLSDRSNAAVQFAKNFLMSYSGVGTTINPPYPTRAYESSGLTSIYAGKDACTFYGVGYPDSRAPDIVGIAAYGVVYTSGVKKISEHGGFNTEDRNVPIVVSGSCLPKGNAGVTVVDEVMTTQIGPTILSLLGLDPYRLAAVQIEKTEVLPIVHTATASGNVVVKCRRRESPRPKPTPKQP